MHHDHPSDNGQHAPNTGIPEAPRGRRVDLPIAAIRPNPHSPAGRADAGSLQELKRSIAERGVVNPIEVRQIETGRYEITEGERRWRAAQALGHNIIPAIVLDAPDDSMFRADPNPPTTA